MKRFLFTLIIPLSLLTTSCTSDDGPTITEEQRQLIMGDEGEGVLLGGFTAPIVVENDGIHSFPIDLDLDRNTEIDIELLASQGFFGDKSLIISTPNAATNPQLLVNEDGLVIPLNSGDIVKFDEGTWAVADEAPLAVYDPSDQSTTGLWNGLSNKYVAFKMQIGNTRYLAWIELSVSDYDNFSFHNHGLKIVP